MAEIVKNISLYEFEKDRVDIIYTESIDVSKTKTDYGIFEIIGCLDPITNEPIFNNKGLSLLHERPETRVLVREKFPRVSYPLAYAKKDAPWELDLDYLLASDLAAHRELAFHLLDEELKIFGLRHFMLNIAQNLGLLDVLRASFPDQWRVIFSLAIFAISENEGLNYAQNWLNSQYTQDLAHDFTPEAIEDFFHQGVSESQRQVFYQSWSRLVPSKRYLAWEERMISNYRSEIYDPNFSDFIDEVENKINTCILFNVETRLPVCQSVYTGSLKNPETLNQVFADFENLTTKADKITLFLGTEFYKDKILRLYKKFDFKYIINMPFSIAITEQLVNDAKKFIFETEYVIFSPNDSLKGITLDSELLKIDPKAQARIFLDLAYHLEDRAQFDLQLQELVTLYLSGDKKITHDKLFKKYIHINPNLPIDDKRHVLIDHLAFEDALAVSGWIVFISNSSIDNQNLHYGWLAKESIKNYTFYSNSVFNLEKYKPYVDDAVENKLLVSFIVSILSYHIQKVFEDNKLHKEYSLNDLVNNISIIDCYIDKKGQTVTQKLSPEQQQYYDLFKIPAPQACYPPGFDLDE